MDPSTQSPSVVSREVFIAQATKQHSSRYKYQDFPKEVDLNSQLFILCPVHGDFKQTASRHLSGWGCARCAGCHSYTTKTWIEAAQKLHPASKGLDFSTVEYVNDQTRVVVKCKQHGQFSVLPPRVLQPSFTCPDEVANAHP